ncbi:winged helix-turn-helix domain-containing protein [Streptomyces sp. NPDC014986]|uniref:winged helix-turn-helix domain-containing protein n=1 Tax=Streptomyces sp. NPDC014986 TaxID=3364934 RepID=UPI0036FA9E21
MSGAALVWAMRHKRWCQSTGELAVLTAIAEHMNKDLKNSYASQSTIAEETFMSARSVGTHMRNLAKRGVIVPGDPEVVSHIRPDRRPPVWDFPADLPKDPPATGNDFHPAQRTAEHHPRQRVETDATRKRATGGKSAQPRVETVADEPGSTEPGESVGGDGRRPSTGSRSRASGGKAVSGKKARRKVSPADLRKVVEGIPAPLAARLEHDFPNGLPLAVNEAVAQALLDEQRTADQLIERAERRWLHWSYEDDAVSVTGRGLDRPLAVLLTLLGPSACWGNNARCEDGIDIDTREDCPRCVEAREDKAAARAQQDPPAGGYSVPFQPPAAYASSPYVRCQGADCGVKMLPTPDGLCRECRDFQTSEPTRT